MVPEKNAEWTNLNIRLYPFWRSDYGNTEWKAKNSTIASRMNYMLRSNYIISRLLFIPAPANRNVNSNTVKYSLSKYESNELIVVLVRGYGYTQSE